MKKDLLNEIKQLWEIKNLSAIRSLLLEENPVDIAETFEELGEKVLPTIYRLLPKELAAEVFVELDGDAEERLIHALSDKELSETLSELFYDDTADLIEEMPAGVVKRILKNSSPSDRAEINKLLKFKDDSAGSIMTTEFVGLKKEMTVGQALDYIRRVALDKETIYNCYVTDETRRLEGLITARVLLTSPTDHVIGDLMETNVISVKTTDDKEEVGRMLAKYDFLALPVVDSEERLVGIVTYDDAMDVIEEETTEDFEKMAAMLPNEKPYLKQSVWSIWKARIPWLLLLMVSATFTGMIISSFEASLGILPILTVFIPMLMDTGGNSGSQSSVTVIRALSLDELHFKDIFTVIWKEVRAAALCAIALAAVCFGKVMLVDRLLMGNTSVTVLVDLTVCLTLAVTVIVAKVVGCSLPLIAKRFGFDPAVMASPFITTIVDAMSLLLYFLFAKAILGV